MSVAKLGGAGAWSVWFLASVGVALGACTPTSSPGTTASEPTGASGFPVPSGAAGGTAMGVDGGIFAESVTCGSADGGMPVPPLLGGAAMGSPFGPQLAATITHAATPVPPISGGTLLALADGVTVVAADPERDQISFVDFTTYTVTAKVPLQAGDEPGRIVQDAAGRVHVALRRGGAIVTLDPKNLKTGAVISRRAVCSAPRGIAYEAATDLVHVACAGGELVSLPAAGGAITRTLTLDRDLRDVVVAGNGKLMVSTFRRADVIVLGADGTVEQRMRPGSGQLASFNGMAQERSPAVAWRMVSRGDSVGSVVMLHQTGVDDIVDPVAGGYGGVKGCSAIAQAGVTVMPQGNGAGGAGGAGGLVASGIEMVSLAVDIALAPDGQTAAIAVPGNTDSMILPTLVTVDVTQMNTGVPCVGTTGSFLMGGPSSQVVAVSYAKDGTLLAQTREPSTVYRVDTKTSVSLATDSRGDAGHEIFHVNAGGGLACASCHPEGGEDGRVWNFACTGARRTQSIRGGISQTAPFHWDGSEPTFSHLMDDVFSGRMSGPALSDDQKTALQSWVDTIPAMPVTAGLDASAVARGKTMFTDPSYGCATCHAGTLLTNNATVDVGTGGLFQVPSLRGVAWRAPFMHTGCAATLADRFAGACGGGDKHGPSSTLTTAQVGDLVAYLQSL